MDIIGKFKGLENALDAASLRQQVIANNIANAGSPSFRSQGVAFEDEFKKALASKDDDMGFRAVSLEDEEGDFSIGGGSDSSQVRAKVYDTGNKVDINSEMVNLARNQIHYNMLADRLSGFMGSVKMVIDSTGR